MERELILVRYGEVFLKGLNRPYFMRALVKNVKKAVAQDGADVWLHDGRILIAGKATVTEEAARVFAEEGILLIGNESQTVGPEDAPMQVHLILLGAEVILLEGIVLKDIPEGKYFLNAAPLQLGGIDGAPCRAWLMEPKEE